MPKLKMLPSYHRCALPNGAMALVGDDGRLQAYRRNPTDADFDSHAREMKWDWIRKDCRENA